MPLLAPPSPDLVLKKIGEAGNLLGWDEDWLLSKAGWSEQAQSDLRQHRLLPSLSKFKALAKASGLPLEFFLSDYRVPVTPTRFRAGTSEVEVEDGTDSAYYQRKAILRLATLADLLASVIDREAVRPFMNLREAIAAKGGNPARLLLKALKLHPTDFPIGPKLASGLGSLGVQVIYAAIYHEAKLVGLSWWQRGFLPIVACATSISVKRSYFTVAHEVIHLLADVGPGPTSDGFRCIPVPSEKKAASAREERQADQAAAELLMPDELLPDAQAAVDDEGAVSAARHLAGEWEVSTQAAALRLVTWGLAEWSEIKELFEPIDWAPRAKRPHKGFGTPERTQDILRLLYRSGVSAGYLSWATGLPLDRVLVDLGRLRQEDLSAGGSE